MAIELIDKIKQKNGGNFKLVDAEDVALDNSSVKEVIDDVKAQMTQRAKASEVRHNNVPIKLSDLHTDVKQAMTGGSVAVVGANAVGDENLKDGAVSPSKLKYQANMRYKGQMYPLKNVMRDGILHNEHGTLKNVILDCKIFNGDPDKYYRIEFISNGAVVANKPRYSVNMFRYDNDWSNRVQVVSFSEDELFPNHVPQEDVETRIYKFKNDSGIMVLTIDWSALRGQINIEDGDGRGLIVDPSCVYPCLVGAKSITSDLIAPKAVTGSKVGDKTLTVRNMANDYMFNTHMRFKPSAPVYNTLNMVIPTTMCFVDAGTPNMPEDLSKTTCLLEVVTCEDTRFMYQKICAYTKPQRYYIRYCNTADNYYPDWTLFDLMNVESKVNNVQKSLLDIVESNTVRFHKIGTGSSERQRMLSTPLKQTITTEMVGQQLNFKLSFSVKKEDYFSHSNIGYKIGFSDNGNNCHINNQMVLTISGVTKNKVTDLDNMLVIDFNYKQTITENMIGATHLFIYECIFLSGDTEVDRDVVFFNENCEGHDLTLIGHNKGDVVSDSLPKSVRELKQNMEEVNTQIQSIQYDMDGIRNANFIKYIIECDSINESNNNSGEKQRAYITPLDDVITEDMVGQKISFDMSYCIEKEDFLRLNDLGFKIGLSDNGENAHVNGQFCLIRSGVSRTSLDDCGTFYRVKYRLNYTIESKAVGATHLYVYQIYWIDGDPTVKRYLTVFDERCDERNITIKAHNYQCRLFETVYPNGLRPLKNEIDTIKNDVTHLTETVNLIQPDDIEREHEILHERISRLEKRNEFCWKPFDKAYVTIVFDDGRHDVDKVFDIFKEYNVSCTLAIPSRWLKNRIDSGRTNIDVVRELIQDPKNEFMGHTYNHSVITTNSDKEHVLTQLGKAQREYMSYGLNVRGSVLAGGRDSLGTYAASNYDDVGFGYIARRYYEYGDKLAYAPQYNNPRKYFNQSLEQGKLDVDKAIANKQWIRYFAHTLDGSESLITEENLRGFIEYVLSKGSDKIEFTTYAHMYDTFGTTEFEKRLSALESK